MVHTHSTGPGPDREGDQEQWVSLLCYVMYTLQSNRDSLVRSELNKFEHVRGRGGCMANSKLIEFGHVRVWGRGQGGGRCMMRERGQVLSLYGEGGDRFWEGGSLTNNITGSCYVGTHRHT